MKFKHANNKVTSVIQAEQPCYYALLQINVNHSWIKQLLCKGLHCVKSVRIWRFSGLFFPAFIVNLRIQSECGKIWNTNSEYKQTLLNLEIIA